MTNLLVKLTLILATNWTSVEVGTNQLGYVQTNHVLTVEYQSTTNTFILLSDPSNIAVWRSLPFITCLPDSGGVTNIYLPNFWWDPGRTLTNVVVPQDKDILLNEQFRLFTNQPAVFLTPANCYTPR